jgi:hypothetical protein
MANLIPRTDLAGGAAGVLPFGWSLGANTTGLTYTILAPSLVGGFPSFNFTVSGTATATGSIYILFTPSSYNIPVTPLVNYTLSAYLRLVAGATTSMGFVLEGDGGTSALGYVSTPFDNGAVPTGTQARINQTAQWAATTALAQISYGVTVTSGIAYNATLSVAGLQLELGSAPTAFQPTPAIPPAPWQQLAPIMAQ